MIICVAAARTPVNPARFESSNSGIKRDVLVGDMSYSYAATDFGVHNGSHVKTITVIKNYGNQKVKNSEPVDSVENREKNRFDINENFKVIVKLPERPVFDEYFVHTERVSPKNHPTTQRTTTTTTTRMTRTTRATAPTTQSHQRRRPDHRPTRVSYRNNDNSNVVHRLNSMQDEILHHLSKDMSDESAYSEEAEANQKELPVYSEDSAAYSRDSEANAKDSIAHAEETGAYLEDTGAYSDDQGYPEQGDTGDSGEYRESYQYADDTGGKDDVQSAHSGNSKSSIVNSDDTIHSGYNDDTDDTNDATNLDDSDVYGTRHNYGDSDDSSNNVVRTKIHQDVEIFSTAGYEVPRDPHRNAVMVEDFSDYSMHHVKHLTDPKEVWKHPTRFHVSDRAGPAHHKKVVHMKTAPTAKSATSAPPFPMLKSQSLADISHQIRNSDDDDDFFEPLKIRVNPNPIKEHIPVSTKRTTTTTLAPITQKHETTFRTHTPRPLLKLDPQTLKNLNYLKKLPSKIISTTQEPYIAPLKRRFSSQIRQAPLRSRVIPAHEYMENDTPFTLNSNYKISGAQY